MDTQYVKATGLWTIDDRLKRAVEVQVISEDFEELLDNVPVELLTVLQMFGTNTGNPLSGQLMLDPTQLRKLHEAIGKRLTELDEKAVQP